MRNGAYHQVYLLRRESLVNILRLKQAPCSLSRTNTPDLSPVMTHRERTIVSEGDESHGGGGKSSRRLADSRVNDPRIERPNMENAERPFTRRITWCCTLRKVDSAGGLRGRTFIMLGAGFDAETNVLFPLDLWIHRTQTYDERVLQSFANPPVPCGCKRCQVGRLESEDRRWVGWTPRHSFAMFDPTSQKPKPPNDSTLGVPSPH